MDYKKLKDIFITFSIVYFIIDFINKIDKISFLNTQIPIDIVNSQIILGLYAFIFFITFIHLLVDENKHNFNFEIIFISIVFLIVIISKLWKLILLNLPEYIVTLIFLIIVSYLTRIPLQEFSLIRSKEESQTLNLPRVSIASRSVLIFVPLLVIIIILIYISIAYYFLDWNFINQYFNKIILLPLSVLVFLFNINEVLFHLKLYNWESTLKYKQELKVIYNNHDRSYQMLDLLNTQQFNSNSIQIFSYIKNDDCGSVDEYYLKGNDPNEYFEAGYTALIFASAEGKINCVKKLIEHGADLNAVNLKGNTALCYAARYNYYKIVKLLIENGANPNRCNLNTYSPLQIACLYGHTESVEILLECENIDLYRKTLIENKTALQIAMDNKYGNIAQIIRLKMKKY